jgi:RHS repeat-associated protein
LAILLAALSSPPGAGASTTKFLGAESGAPRAYALELSAALSAVEVDKVTLDLEQRYGVNAVRLGGGGVPLLMVTLPPEQAGRVSLDPRVVHVLEREASAESKAPLRNWESDHIYRGAQLLASETPTGGRRFHLDHLGTPRLVTDNLGRVVSKHSYYPFGSELAAASPEQPEERHKFTGHERDLLYGGNVDTLDYMHARFYSGGTGRFLSADPVIDQEATQEPHLWNRYSYAGNSPSNYEDSTGRERELPYCVRHRCSPKEVEERSKVGKQVFIIAGLLNAPFVLYETGLVLLKPEVLLLLMGMGNQMVGASTGPRIGPELAAMESRLGNIFGQELDNPTIQAAARETFGEVVATKASGEAFDHITKMNQGISGAKSSLDALKKLAGDARLTPAQRAQVMTMLSKYSKMLDDAQLYFQNLVKQMDK